MYRRKHCERRRPKKPPCLQSKKRVIKKLYVKDAEKEFALTFDGIPVRTLYVTNLPQDATWKKVNILFSQYGEIKTIYIRQRQRLALPKLFAFVTFISPESAFRALRLSRELTIDESKLYITAADSWHQPIELSDGTIQWKCHSGQNSSTSNNNQFEENKSEEGDEEEGDIEGGISKIQLVYKEEVAADSIHRLNNDCLRHVFLFLNLKERICFERVCKRWQEISLNTWKLIHELDFTESNLNSIVPLTTVVLEQLVRHCGVTLNSLNLSITDHELGDNTLHCIAKHCPNLEEIRVSKLDIGNRGLAYLGKSCTKLKLIQLYECENFSDHDLKCLLVCSKELKTFDLTERTLCKNIGGRCLTKIKGPIHRLALSKCGSFKMTSVFPQNLILGLQTISATLTHLTLDSCCNLGNNYVSRIVQTVPNITSLTLSGFLSTFDHASLIPIGQLAKLEELNLSNNRAVNDDVIKSIVNGCKELTTLNLCGNFSGSSGNIGRSLTEYGISTLGKLNRLVSLNISYLDQATDTALKNLTLRSPPLKYLVCRGCPLISDDGCTNVVSLCNDLVLFDVSGCNGVTDITVVTAGDSVTMRTNNTELNLIIGGTSAEATKSPYNQLHLDLADNCKQDILQDFIIGNLHDIELF